MTPPTRTVDDLRTAMESRVAGLSAPAQLAARVAERDRIRRTRYRAATGVVVAAAAAAIGIPLAIGLDGTETGPSDPGPTSPDGWTSALPGLDLREGEPLDVPYVVNESLIMDGRAVPLDEPLEVTSFLAVPDGVVVERGPAPQDSFSLPTSLELIRADGSAEVLDTGIIAGSAGARMPDGSVQIVYGWLAGATATSGEIRVLELGSGDPPRRIEVEQPMIVEAPEGQNDIARGRVLIQPVDGVGGGELMSLDLATGELTPAGFGSAITSIGISAGGLDVRLDTDRQCVVAWRQPGAETWSVCTAADLGMRLSPDGTVLFGATAVYDAETGERLADLSLPDDPTSINDMSGLRSHLTAWEDRRTALYVVTYAAEDPDPANPTGALEPMSYVIVRCSIDGSCDRVPHEVDMIGELAR